MRVGFIDWTDSELHFYIFEKRGGSYVLESRNSAAVEEKPETDSLSGFSGEGLHHIYLSLPPSRLSLRELNFPFSDEKKISDTISYELEGLLLGSTDDFSIDHIVLESNESSRVLAACIDKKELNSIINTLSSAGLEPKAITSLDLKISGSSYENALQGHCHDIQKRADAAAEELSNPTINLRQGELSFTGDMDRLRKASRLTALLVLILLILFAAGTTIKYKTLKREQNMLKGAVERSFRSAFPEDTRVVDVSRQFKGKLNLLKKKKEALAGIAVLDILKKTTAIMDGTATLSEFKADGNNIILKGVVPSFKDVELIKNSLSIPFDHVNVTESEASRKKVRFTIVMKGKGA